MSDINGFVLTKALTNLKDESHIMPQGDPSVGYPQICLRSNRKPEPTDLDAICDIADEAASAYPDDRNARAKAVVKALNQILGGGSLGHAWIIVFESQNVTNSNSHRYGYHEGLGFTKNKSNDRPERGFAYQFCLKITPEQFAALENEIISELNEESTEIAKNFNMSPGAGQQGVYTPVTNCTWFAGNVWNRTMEQSVEFKQAFSGEDHADDWGIDYLYKVNDVADPGYLSMKMQREISISNDFIKLNFINGKSIAELQISEALEKNSHIHIDLYNGNWSPNIYIPDRVPFDDATLYITSNADYESKIHIMNQVYIISKNQDVILLGRVPERWFIIF
ncbi:hypothetical protein [Klebsiella sp. BIGb0407]|uniref:hypothetical protein n=1 Tax=Klebsiella sp. BIGb0407 TaxID=2940603 RepID=UPI00216AA4B1|nr:hypothetical protein [Klebsiella sp. BIGb0407]MCS3430880.1 hypothetical protein [Klebsiella sp. BIGb0407]